jgi:hypothetical protein
MVDRHTPHGLPAGRSPEPSLSLPVKLCFPMLSSGVALEGMRLLITEARESATETTCVSI